MVLLTGTDVMETYSRGWRGAPAKGVGRETGARVQIPLSPFIWLKIFQKEFQKRWKKFLTNRKRYDRINELLLKNREQQKQSSLKTEQYVKPWKFL